MIMYVYKETIKKLNPLSKKLFDNLKYILNDEELALGYLGTFEYLIEKEILNAKIDVLKEVNILKNNKASNVMILIDKYKIELSKIKTNEKTKF